MNPLVEQFLNELNEFAPDLGNAHHRADGMSLGEFLAAQADAVLAGAIARAGPFRNAIIVELLVDRYRPRLCRLLFALGADQDTADNLLQDLCANVVGGALDNFDANQEFGRYVRTIVRHQFYSYYTTVRRRRTVFTEDMRDAPGPDTVDQEVEMHELFNRFEEALRELPEMEQEVMRMTCDGWTPRDIANAMEMDIRSIYIIRTSCREYLAQLLAPALPALRRGRPRLSGNADSTCDTED